MRAAPGFGASRAERRAHAPRRLRPSRRRPRRGAASASRSASPALLRGRRARRAGRRHRHVRRGARRVGRARAPRRVVLGRVGRPSCAAPRTSRPTTASFARCFWRQRASSTVVAAEAQSRSRSRSTCDDADDARRPTRRRRRATTCRRCCRSAGARPRSCATATSPRTRPTEFDEAQRLMADLRLAGALRRSRRRRPAARDRGRPDLRRTVRRVAARRRRAGPRGPTSRPATRPRRIVLLCDVSGSMEPYARALLRFLHAAVVGPRPGRGVRARHPAHPHHPRAVVARSRRRARPRPRAGSSTGRAAPASARACGSSTTGGACGAWPAARSSSSSPTAGTAATPRCSAEQMARLAAGRVPDRVGEPAQGDARSTPRWPAGWPRRCRTSTSSSRATRSAALEDLVEVDRRRPDPSRAGDRCMREVLDDIDRWRAAGTGSRSPASSASTARDPATRARRWS